MGEERRVLDLGVVLGSSGGRKGVLDLGEVLSLSRETGKGVLDLGMFSSTSGGRGGGSLTWVWSRV